MSSRHVHPLACRRSRTKRAAVVAYARANGFSISGLLNAALDEFMAAHPGVNPGVNSFRESAPFGSPLLPVALRPNPAKAVRNAAPRPGAMRDTIPPSNGGRFRDTLPR